MNDYDYKKLDNYHKAVDSTVLQTNYVISFINRVYGWMFAGLIVTAAISYFCAISPDYVRFITQNPNFIFVPAIVGFVIVLALNFAINKISAVAATMGFLLYAAANGFLFSTLLLTYTGQSIATTFLVTAGTFGVMSLYGYITKSDLTKLGNIMIMAVIGLVLAMLVNIFLKSSMLEIVISCIGVIAFCGLTAYDTQKIKNIALGVKDEESGAEPVKKLAIIGALALYLDFINLFLFLLRFLGRRD